MKNIINNFKNYILLFSFFMSGQAFAQTSSGITTNILTMFENFTNSSKAIISLTMAISTVIGVYLVGSSIYKMATLGDTGGQRGETMRGPITRFFIGIMLFSLAYSLNTVGLTISLSQGPGLFLSEMEGTGNSKAVITGILWFIRMIGFISVVRGFLILDAHGSGRGGQDGGLGRGLTHIFGGAAAIHIDVFAKVLFNTFAPGMTVPF